jgi:hypothetical protein
MKGLNRSTACSASLYEATHRTVATVILRSSLTATKSLP